MAYLSGWRGKGKRSFPSSLSRQFCCGSARNKIDIAMQQNTPPLL
jgi:hypothetical protein